MSPQEAKDRSPRPLPEKPPEAAVAPAIAEPIASRPQERPVESRGTEVEAASTARTIGVADAEENNPWKALKKRLGSIFSLKIEGSDVEQPTPPSQFVKDLFFKIEAETVRPDRDLAGYVQKLVEYRDLVGHQRSTGEIGPVQARQAGSALNIEMVRVIDLYGKNLSEEARIALFKNVAEEGGAGGVGGIPDYTTVPHGPGDAYDINDAQKMEALAKAAFDTAISLGGRIDQGWRAWFWHSAYFRNAFIDELMLLQDALPTTPAGEYQDIVTQMIPQQFLLALDNPADPDRTRNLRRIYGEYRELRRNAHDLAIIAETGEAEQLAQSLEVFKVEKYDKLFSITGVAAAIRCYERAWERVRAENKGDLPYEDLVYNFKTQTSRVDDLARSMLLDLSLRSLLYRVDDENRRSPNRVNLTNHEVDRALALARSYMLISLRAHEHVAKSGPPTPKSEHLKSFFGEKITRSLDMVRWLITRFNIGEDQGAKTIAILAYPLDYKPRFFFKRDTILRSVWGIDLDTLGKRIRDLMNITGAGSWLTGSAWRIDALMKGAAPILKQNSGFAMRLAMLRGAAEVQATAEIRQRAGRNEFKQEQLLETEHYSHRFHERVNELALDGFTDTGGTVHEGSRALVQQLARRNPLRIIHMLRDLNLMEREDLYREALGLAAGVPVAPALMHEIEDDLSLVAEERIIRDYTSNDMRYAAVISDPARAGRAERVAGFVSALVDSSNPLLTTADMRDRSAGFRDTIGSKNWEYAPGFEDIPWEDMDFIKMGGRAMTRKVVDFTGHKKGWEAITDLLNELPTMKNSEEIANYLKEKVWKQFASYNAGVANRIVFQLGKGITFFFKKDWKAAPPFIPFMGSLYGLLGRSSVAEYAYGRHAMSWDEQDCHHFAHELLTFGMLSKAQEHHLSSEIGATGLNRTSWWFRGSFALSFLSVLNKIFEETKKPIKV